MNPWLQYLLLANLLLLAGTGLYRLLLAGRGPHGWNRVFLLGLPVAAFLAPLLRIPGPERGGEVFGIVGMLPEVIVSAVSGVEVSSVWGLWSVAYLAGAALLATFAVWRVAVLVIHLRKGRRRAESGYVVVEGTGLGPASFGRFLFWEPEEDLDSESARLIRAHELAHIRLGHSFDVLWLELLRVICWFNPAVYALDRSLREVHEFQADAAAAGEADRLQLKALIAARTLGLRSLSVVNHFSSFSHKRILMLNKSQSRRSRWAYLLVLPLMGGLLVSASLVTAQSPANKGGQTELTGGETMPRPLNMAEVAQKVGYPKAAQEAGLEGKVMVRLLVDKNGAVASHEVLKSPGQALTEAVEAHVYELKFTPGEVDGKVVKTYVTLPFAFKLAPEGEKHK